MTSLTPILNRPGFTTVASDLAQQMSNPRPPWDRTRLRNEPDWKDFHPLSLKPENAGVAAAGLQECVSGCSFLLFNRLFQSELRCDRACTHSNTEGFGSTKPRWSGSHFLLRFI